MQTFLSNRAIIEYLNAAHDGDSDAAKFGLNKTADLTDAQFQKMLGLDMGNNRHKDTVMKMANGIKEAV